MQKWEYRVAYCDELTECGADGWEAVGVINTWDEGYSVLMKRPLPKASLEYVEYGIFLNTGPQSSGWLNDGTGRIITGSHAAMKARASSLDKSWGAEVLPLP